MKIKYRPSCIADVDGPWLEFDSEKHVICCVCGTVKSKPPLWVEHQTIVQCRNLNSPNSKYRDDGICGSCMMGVVAVLGDDCDRLAVQLRLGHLDKANIYKYFEWRVRWYTVLLRKLGRRYARFIRKLGRIKEVLWEDFGV